MPRWFHLATLVLFHGLTFAAAPTPNGSPTNTWHSSWSPPWIKPLNLRHVQDLFFAYGERAEAVRQMVKDPDDADNIRDYWRSYGAARFYTNSLQIEYGTEWTTNRYRVANWPFYSRIEEDELYGIPWSGNALAFDSTAPDAAWANTNVYHHYWPRESIRTEHFGYPVEFPDGTDRQIYAFDDGLFSLIPFFLCETGTLDFVNQGWKWVPSHSFYDLIQPELDAVDTNGWSYNTMLYTTVTAPQQAVYGTDDGEPGYFDDEGTWVPTDGAEEGQHVGFRGAYGPFKMWTPLLLWRHLELPGLIERRVQKYWTTNDTATLDLYGYQVGDTNSYKVAVDEEDVYDANEYSYGFTKMKVPTNGYVQLRIYQEHVRYSIYQVTPTNFAGLYEWDGTNYVGTAGNLVESNGVWRIGTNIIAAVSDTSKVYPTEEQARWVWWVPPNALDGNYIHTNNWSNSVVTVYREQHYGADFDPVIVIDCFNAQHVARDRQDGGTNGPWYVEGGDFIEIGGPGQEFPPSDPWPIEFDFGAGTFSATNAAHADDQITFDFGSAEAPTNAIYYALNPDGTPTATNTYGIGVMMEIRYPGPFTYYGRGLDYFTFQGLKERKQVIQELKRTVIRANTNDVFDVGGLDWEYTNSVPSLLIESYTPTNNVKDFDGIYTYTDSTPGGTPMETGDYGEPGTVWYPSASDFSTPEWTTNNTPNLRFEYRYFGYEHKEEIAQDYTQVSECPEPTPDDTTDTEWYFQSNGWAVVDFPYEVRVTLQNMTTNLAANATIYTEYTSEMNHHTIPYVYHETDWSYEAILSQTFTTNAACTGGDDISVSNTVANVSNNWYNTGWVFESIWEDYRSPGVFMTLGKAVEDGSKNDEDEFTPDELPDSGNTYSRSTGNFAWQTIFSVCDECYNTVTTTDASHKWAIRDMKPADMRCEGFWALIEWEFSYGD